MHTGDELLSAFQRAVKDGLQNGKASAFPFLVGEMFRAAESSAFSSYDKIGDGYDFMNKGKYMKKTLILLLLIGAAYWGYGTGTDVLNTAVPHGNAPAVKTEKQEASGGILDTLKDTAGGLVSGLTGDKAEKTTDSETSSEEPGQLQSLSELYSVTENFPSELEKRVDRKKFVPPEEIPEHLKHAVVATEDRRFYEHGAVDPIGVVRAAFINYTSGETLEGGSTISQQTVKNLFLSHERTMMRKLEELVLAVELERTYTKDQILSLYLNTIYFGHGAYGLREAAQTYFHKEPKNLSLAECAMLAGLPQAPSAYDPISYPEEGLKRMGIVIGLMASEGYITPAEAAGAMTEQVLKQKS